MRVDPTHTNLSQLSDETLLEQMRIGDMRAFNALFERHSHRGVELAAIIAGDRFEAEEIVSDVFFSFWARKENLPPIPLFQAYLFTAIRYRAKTITQRRKTVQLMPLDDYASRPEDSPADPLRQLASGELANILHTAIDQLPAQRKLVFKLSRIDGLSYKTIASILNISESTVKNQLAAALRTLRISLSAYPLALPVLLWPALPLSF
jgi:RNA polymerase sigma-70 factor (ECF subfamily)